MSLRASALLRLGAIASPIIGVVFLRTNELCNGPGFAATDFAFSIQPGRIRRDAFPAAEMGQSAR
jgi:hypothetical protein